MSFLTSVKDFLLPDASTAAARRKDVFGTESKTVAAVAIGAAAAGLIAAPAAIGAGGIAKVGQAIAGSSLKTKAALAIGAPIALGAITHEPKVITRTAGGLANLESNLYQAGKDPSFSNVVDVFKENPVLATGLTVVAGAGAAYGVSKLVDAATEKAKGAVDSFLPSAPSINTNPLASFDSPRPASGALTPLTPETIVVGKSNAPATRKRIHRKSPTKAQPQRQSLRVNILNQNTYISRRS